MTTPGSIPTHDRPKKAWECELLHRLMSCLGKRREEWTFEAGERPDFRVEIIGGRRMGIELTEILVPGQGQDRSLDRRLVQGLREATQEYLSRHGGVGASILGHTRQVPTPSEDLTHITSAFRQHLERHGSELAVDGGSMRVTFEHKYGRVACITRRDVCGGIETIGDNNAAPPSYRASRDPQVLTTAMGKIVTEKAARAANYNRELPLWLALRNPSQRMLRVPPPLRALTRACATETFERVIVFNDPEGVSDLNPPKPRFLDLL